MTGKTREIEVVWTQFELVGEPNNQNKPHQSCDRTTAKKYMKEVQLWFTPAFLLIYKG
ncbi:MAG: hypothetical protein PUP93_08370 [Rhizonema sp. NSF051]|nr:hypothetical protein [Rhizonema sp. NSF051]